MLPWASSASLGIPIDGGQLQLPAVLVAHGLSKIQVEAGVLAVVADEAVRRIALVEADRQGFLAVSGVAAGLVARARATRQQAPDRASVATHATRPRTLLLMFPSLPRMPAGMAAWFLSNHFITVEC